MDEYEIVVEAMSEQYRYVVQADTEQEARNMGSDAAIADGWSGFGQVIVRCMSR